MNTHEESLKQTLTAVLTSLVVALIPSAARAAEAATDPLQIFGIPLEFILFGATILGVALAHRRNLEIALAGLAAIAALRIGFTGLDPIAHLAHEARLILNLIGLLLGFALLARHFSDSGLPDWMPRWLPDNWAGGFVLLGLVAALSAIVDNIAGAVIGGVVARKVYRNRVGVGYLAAIVAASNAGGSGSVIGATTTTMLWIAGASVLNVADAFIGAVVALAFAGVFAARRQHRLQPIAAPATVTARLDPACIVIVGAIIAAAIGANLWIGFPAAGVWAAILLGGVLRPIPWRDALHALRGAVFLSALVLGASLLRLDGLPPASWTTALIMGFVSAVFDNIPLMALAIFQGGYDWGLLAFAVAYGGSIVWFGSSAGVAISNDFPEVRDTVKWLREGWPIVIAYLLGFFAILALTGWHPTRLR